MTFRKTLMAMTAAAFVAAGAMVASTAFAQAPAAGKPSAIRVLNLVEVFNRLDAKIAGDNEIKALGEKLDQDRKKLEDEAGKLRETLTQGIYKKDSAEYRQTEEALLRKAAELESHAMFTERRLIMEQRLKTIAIYRELMRGVEEYAKANNIALVLMTDTPDLVTAKSVPEVTQKIAMKKVIYAHESMDITRDVINALNAEYTRNKKP